MAVMLATFGLVESERLADIKSKLTRHRELAMFLSFYLKFLNETIFCLITPRAISYYVIGVHFLNW